MPIRMDVILRQSLVEARPPRAVSTSSLRSPFFAAFLSPQRGQALRSARNGDGEQRQKVAEGEAV